MRLVISQIIGADGIRKIRKNRIGRKGSLEFGTHFGGDKSKMRAFFVQCFYCVCDFREYGNGRGSFLEELLANVGSLLPAVPCEYTKSFAAWNSKCKGKFGVFCR